MRLMLVVFFCLICGRSAAEPAVLRGHLSLGPAMLGSVEDLLQVVDAMDETWLVLEIEGPEQLPVAEGDRDALILTMKYRVDPAHWGLMICVRFGVATQRVILDDPTDALASRMRAPLSSDTGDFGRYEMIMDCSFSYYEDTPLAPHAVWGVLSALPGQAEVLQNPTIYGRTMLAGAPWTFSFEGDLPAGTEPVLLAALYLADDRQQSLQLRFVLRPPLLS